MLLLAYLITRSARASTLGGILRSICLAVLRLIRSSNLVGCSTGKSLGFAPFRILSTRAASRRCLSTASNGSQGHEHHQPQHQLDRCTAPAIHFLRQAQLSALDAGSKSQLKYASDLPHVVFLSSQKHSRIPSVRLLQILQAANGMIEQLIELPQCSCAWLRLGMQEAPRVRFSE